MRFIVPLAVSIATTTACTDDAGPDVGSEVSFEYPAGTPDVNVGAQLDLLVVVDTSAAIAPYRDALVASYRRFAAALAYEPGIIPDLHLGVVTADLGGPGCEPGDGAAFRRVPTVAGEFIVDTPVTSAQRVVNYTVPLAEAIAELADAGSGGCAVSRPLDVMQRALATANGFRRPGADLAVVFVAATDDASELSVDAAYADLTATTEPRRIAVEVIGGPDDATCGNAVPRLSDLAARFGAGSGTTSLCASDHADAVTRVGQIYQMLLAEPCVRGVAVPYACEVLDVYAGGSSVLESCDATAGVAPCWSFTTGAPACLDGHELHVSRTIGPVVGTITRGQCVASD